MASVIEASPDSGLGLSGKGFDATRDATGRRSLSGPMTLGLPRLHEAVARTTSIRRSPSSGIDQRGTECPVPPINDEGQMVVNRLHSKLFEATALDLDRRTRFHFVGQNVRPNYLKEIESKLQGVMKPDMEGELQFIVHVVEAGPLLEGKFLGFKMFLKKILYPFSAHTAYVHRMIIQRFTEQHESLKSLVATVADENAKIREDFASLAEMVRAKMAEDSALANDSEEFAFEEGKTVPAGSRLILGTVAAKARDYVHFDPTAPGTSPLDRLPVAPGSIGEIVAANVLESYSVDEVRDILLPYWATLLQPGGRLSVIADDLGAAGDRFRDGQIEFSELAAVLFGGGRTPRRSAYTPEMLWQYVEEAGLTDLSVTARKHRPELGAYGFELTAFRDAA